MLAADVIISANSRSRRGLGKFVQQRIAVPTRFQPRNRGSLRGLRRGLGTVSTDVNGNLIYGSDPIQPVTTVSTTEAVPNWGGGNWWGGWNDQYQPSQPSSFWDWFENWFRPRNPGASVYAFGPLGPHRYSLKGLRRRGLGAVGPKFAVQGGTPAQHIVTSQPVVTPVRVTPPASTNPLSPFTGLFGGPSPFGSGLTTSTTSLTTNSLQSNPAVQAAYQLLQSDPNAVTPSQWSLLQQAGLVSANVPYSEASQVYSPSALSSSTTSTALATAEALYQSNPTALTAAQWQLLQQSGFLNSNSLASSALTNPSGVASSSGGYAPATDPNCEAGYPTSTTGLPCPNYTAPATVSGSYSSDGSAFDQDIGPLPLWGWLLIGAGGILLLRKR